MCKNKNKILSQVVLTFYEQKIIAEETANSIISHLSFDFGYGVFFDCVDHNKLWKILKEMGIPYHLTCLLRNLYSGQEATVRAGHETMEWFQIRDRKSVV